MYLPHPTKPSTTQFNKFKENQEKGQQKKPKIIYKKKSEILDYRNLLGEVHRIRMIAPGNKTLFLKGRMPSLFGSSTVSPISLTFYKYQCVFFRTSVCDVVRIDGEFEK